jgi:hypothetical protein
MNTMVEKELACRDGIGFLACMNDWKMKNFEVNYCYQFMMTLQAFVVPVTVQLFLIVNPPSWFGVIWRLMKPMLAPSFRKKVKVIQENMLNKYLEDGIEAFLPDDLETGEADTEALCLDFITYRKSVENKIADSSWKEEFFSHIPSYNPGFLESSPVRSDFSFPNGSSTSRTGHHYVQSSARRLAHSFVSNVFPVDDDDASIHCDIEDDNLE